MALENGKKLGPYEIIEPAGVGGMGEVYKARDTRLDRTVAIKVLPENMALNADLKSRFDREAKAISSLNHPNICTLHDIGSEAGIDFLVMEFLEGETLADRLKKGALPLNEVYDIAIEVCDALDKAHRQGLIHRDLKPGNIMLTREGAKLMDFGLAKLQRTEGAEQNAAHVTQTTPLTGAGTIVGTLQYMSPEQLEGTEADARSDIFAFGVVLYEMLTGAKAFSGKSQATLIASIIGTEPPAVSEIKPMTPPGLSRLVKKCLEKEPENRWQSARDLTDELRWISHSGSQAGIPVTVAAKRKFKFDLARLVGLVAIVGMVGLGYLYYTERNRELPVLITNILPEPGSRLSDHAGGGLAISPDGSKLAYLTYDTVGARRIWVRSLNTLTANPLKGTDHASYPFWSPDGEYIAFFAGNKLKKTLASGGPVLSICDVEDGRPGSWNKDGVIIFNPHFQGPLYKVSAGGGEPTQLTSLDTVQGDFTHRYAEFLPDGDHFLFFARHDANEGSERDEVCISSLSDTSITRLFYAKSNAKYASGYLLFMRESTLMAQRFDPSARKLEGDAVPLAEDVSYNARFSRGVFSVSHNGQLVYRKGDVREGSIFRVYSADFTQSDSIGSAEIYDAFELSHDGKLIASSIREPQGVNGELWIHEIKRGIKRRFTFESARTSYPCWSPSDSLIAFSLDRNGFQLLCVQEAAGTRPKEILDSNDTFVLPWSWSPDGSRIVYGKATNGQGDLMIYTFGRDTAVSTYLATSFPEGDARISPDGRWLAYISNESGQWEVYVSTFPTYTVKWQVSVKGGWTPQWSQDGKNIYYMGPDDYLMVADVDGSGSSFKVNEITSLQKLDTRGTYPTYQVLPDGKGFLVSEGIGEEKIAQIIHVYNWTAELN